MICSTFGNRVGFITDAISFGVVACMTLTIPRNYESIRNDSDSKAMSIYQSGESNEASSKEKLSNFQMLKAAIVFLHSEPQVLIICCAKACGALIWSAADILQVKFSNMKSMNSLGGQDLTLGLLYSMVGLGCYVGPVTWNTCTPQNGKILYSRIVSTFINLTVAYFLTMIAPNIFLLALATATRAFGAGTLWTYSTLLLQMWAPPEMKGRLFAFENFLFTLVSIISFFICAMFFDYLKLNERVICLIMGVMGLCVLSLWLFSYLTLFSALESTDIELSAMKVKSGLSSLNESPSPVATFSRDGSALVNAVTYTALALADDVEGNSFDPGSM